MLIPNHPHDERLSALASGDPEAKADSTLSDHVAGCAPCTETVEDLRLLRTSLAELPDLPPHRPLRLLPAMTDAPSRADRLGGWARRFFAPALTAGAAVAMVGLVGTAAPALQGFGASAGAAPQQESADESSDDRAFTAATDATPAAAGGERSPATDANELDAASNDGETAPLTASEAPAARGTDDDELAQRLQIPAERSPWPMVLFTGVAVMIAAALLRWILVPRAG